MRILLSAYACAPHRGSEGGLGWNWARILSIRHQVHVLTADTSRDDIEAELLRHPNPRLHFHFVPDSWRNTSAWPLGAGWAHQRLWQRRAYRQALRLCAAHTFDLTHHVSYSTWRAPPLIGRLNVPFVWGPIGGGQSVPPGFRRTLGLRGSIRESIRSLSQHLIRFDPLVLETLERATVILAANSSTLDFLPRRVRSKTELMLETGIDVPKDVHFRAESQGALQLLWVGYCVPLKGLPLLLESMRLLRDRVPVRLTVIGDGPERRRWARMAEDWGLVNQVTFLGALPYGETQKHYARADVLVFTSLRDTSGNVVLEAMRSGLPTIVLDWAGPRDIVSDECGIKITPRSPEQVAREMADAVIGLYRDPTRRRAMGEAGLLRTRQKFSWTGKSLEIERIYGEALARFSRARS